MKSIKKLIALLLCGAFLLAMAGCQTDTPPAETTTAPTTTAASTEPSLTDIYNEARKAIDEAQDLQLRINFNTTTTVGTDYYKDYSTKELTYQGIGTETMVVHVTEDNDCGTPYQTDEIFAEDMVYLSSDDLGKFSSTMTAEEYLERRPAKMLLDASLYSGISSAPAGSSTLITFTDAEAGESWAIPEEGVLISATGTALISESGEIRKITYSAEYTYGAADITVDVDVFYNTYENEDIISLIPGDTSEYVEIDWIDAPAQMLAAYGHISYITSASYQDTEVVFSAAAGVVFTLEYGVDTYGLGADFMAKYTTEINSTDITGYGQNDSYRLEELYRDGTYSYSENGQEYQTSPGVTASNMANYCMTTMLGDLPDSAKIASLTATEIGGVYVIEYSFANEVGEEVQANICSMLYNDPDFLNNYASSYATDYIDGYLSIDKYTGLPTAAGQSYAGVHILDGQDYPLTLECTTSYYLASADSYEAITDELAPETEPENPATPLFYHVTGNDGQEMWILGTIHVGDERTGFLPQEIYDAFDASDALAVEFDMNEYADRMESDENYAATISSAYFYGDGSTIEDHLSSEEYPELYEHAVLMMKASGNYFSTVPYMKASVWSSSIDNFILQQGYRLTSSKGVDQRLLDLAEKVDKKILSMESAEFQVNMLNGYSDELQELLLEGSVYADALEQRNGTYELFEAWCRGNEAELTEATADDTSDLTEEELALYDEYNNAMLIDRNHAMVETAIEYLESGETVFIAVGLAHVLGETGLVAGLRAAGYTVEVATYANTN